MDNKDFISITSTSAAERAMCGGLVQTYCKPCLCAKHKELRDRKRMRTIQAHLGASGQLHLDPAHTHIVDPNADPYAGGLRLIVLLKGLLHAVLLCAVLAAWIT